MSLNQVAGNSLTAQFRPESIGFPGGSARSRAELSTISQSSLKEIPMSEDPRIAVFLEESQAAGIPHASLVGMLTAYGWREKDIYRALGDHYRKALGLEIPQRAGAGVSAKDAFFYLLIFSTLATWTIGLGSLAFQLIDRWLADPLFSLYQGRRSNYEITWALAALIVAFPLYLLISRTVLREAAADPYKLDSGIRKWLTYMALVVAASVFMGDLICALAFLLRGELTSRFVAKSVVVLALSGGVFFYYFGGLRKTEGILANSSRDKLMAGLSSAAVVLMMILGFWQLGAPASQRQMRADGQRIQELYRLSMEVENYWKSHGSQLPSSINELRGGPRLDPITHTPYEYRSGAGSRYELCAQFARASQGDPVNSVPDAWTHPAGHRCFQLDAAATTEYPAQAVY